MYGPSLSDDGGVPASLPSSLPSVSVCFCSLSFSFSSHIVLSPSPFSLFSALPLPFLSLDFDLLCLSCHSPCLSLSLCHPGPCPSHPCHRRPSCPCQRPFSQSACE